VIGLEHFELEIFVLDLVPSKVLRFSGHSRRDTEEENRQAGQRESANYLPHGELLENNAAITSDFSFAKVAPTARRSVFRGNSYETWRNCGSNVLCAGHVEQEAKRRRTISWSKKSENLHPQG
jgi:hypothetical protein